MRKNWSSGSCELTNNTASGLVAALTVFVLVGALMIGTTTAAQAHGCHNITTYHWGTTSRRKSFARANSIAGMRWKVRTVLHARARGRIRAWVVS